MKRFSKNFLALLSADLLRRFFGFVTVAYLARILGTELFGALNIAYAVLAYGLVLSSGGLTTVGVRSIAQGVPHFLVGRVVSERFLVTLVVVFFIILLSYCFVPEPHTQSLIMLFVLSLIPQAFSLEWYFQGKESMSIVGVTRSLSSFVSMLTALVFVRTPHEVWLLALGAITGEVLAAAVLWRMYARHMPLPRLTFSLRMELFRGALPLTVGVVLSTLVINFPPIALGIFSSANEVGIYSAASKLVFFLLLGDRVLNSLLLPLSSRKMLASFEQLSHMAHDAIRWTLLLAFPLVIGGMLVAHSLVTTVFGASYVSAVFVLQIFLWYFFLTMFHTIMSAVVLALHREKRYSVVMGITAFFYASFVSVGSLFFGAVGAAGGVVLAEGISLFLLWHAVRSFVKIPSLSFVSRCALATATMAVVVWSVSFLPLFLQILAGIVVYGIAVFLSGAVHLSDVRQFVENAI